MERGAWWDTIHRVKKSQTQLRQFSMHTWMVVWGKRFPLCWLSLECGFRCSGCIVRLGGNSVCCAMLCLVTQSCPTLCDPVTVARQAPLSLGFSRQEYWSGLPCLPPGDLPNPEIKPRSPTLQADSLPSEPPGKPNNSGEGRLSLLQGIFATQE